MRLARTPWHFDVFFVERNELAYGGYVWTQFELKRTPTSARRGLGTLARMRYGMWMDEQLKELKEKISGLSDHELLNIVEVEFDDYRQEAIDFAKAELTGRGIKFEEPSSEPVAESFQNEVEAVAPVRRVVACASCGGQTRFGLLLAESEITIIFSDTDEQRFVEAYACLRCGRVQLMVDLETDVDQTSPSRPI